MSTPGIELKITAGEAPDLRLLAENKAENVAIVRQALRGVAEVLALDEDLMVDVNAAVSEACNNVVQHAYGGSAGPMEVYICPDGKELEIVVRDVGQGIRPQPADREVHGVGLSLIQAVTMRTEFVGGEEEGTEVRMTFETEERVDVFSEIGRASDTQISAPDAEVLVAVTMGPLVAPVLGRVATMLAARRGLSVELLSEVQLLADAVAAHSPVGVIGRHIHVGLETTESGIRFRIGPLEEGSAERIVSSSAIQGLPPVLEQLATSLETAAHGEEEFLTLAIEAQ